MREIKFRAFNKETGKMSGSFTFADLKAYDGEVRSIWFENDGDDVEVGNDLGYGENDKSEEYLSKLIFLQYSGLKDRNGTEIYEGDVLRYNEPSADVYIRNSVVKWDDEWAGFHINREPVSSFYEVIGNIYENPELLETI